MSTLGERESVLLWRGRGIWCAKAMACVIIAGPALIGCPKAARVDRYQPEPAGTVKGLRATITSDKKSYQVGEPLKIACRLENITKEEVGIVQIVGPGLKHLRFEIKTPQDKKITYRIRQPATPPARWARMTTIKPHSSWFLTEVINKDDYIFDDIAIFAAPGEYSIAALLEGVTREELENDPDILVGQDVREFLGSLWSGKVKSNVITIEILAGENDFLK